MDRIWGIWGSYYNIPETIFYLIKGGYILNISFGDFGVALRGECLGTYNPDRPAAQALPLGSEWPNVGTIYGSV